MAAPAQDISRSTFQSSNPIGLINLNPTNQIKALKRAAVYCNGMRFFHSSSCGHVRTK